MWYRLYCVFRETEYTVYSMYIPCVYTEYTVYFVYIPCVYTEYTVYSVYIPNVYTEYTVYSVYISCVYTEYTVYTVYFPCVYTEYTVYSVYIPCVYTKYTVYSVKPYILRGPTLFFTNFGHNYHFFLGEKVSSGIWETCAKIIGGYVYQNPKMLRIQSYICYTNFIRIGEQIRDVT